MLAYNYKTHIGLIPFASTPRVTMGVSHVLENLRYFLLDVISSSLRHLLIIPYNSLGVQQAI